MSQRDNNLGGSSFFFVWVVLFCTNSGLVVCGTAISCPVSSLSQEEIKLLFKFLQCDLTEAPKSAKMAVFLIESQASAAASLNIPFSWWLKVLVCTLLSNLCSVLGLNSALAQSDSYSFIYLFIFTASSQFTDAAVNERPADSQSGLQRGVGGLSGAELLIAH